jgi:hypothetical protein
VFKGNIRAYKTQKVGVQLINDSCYDYKQHDITLNHVILSTLCVMYEM